MPGPRVSVVIPFYQRQSGPLGRALASVAAQDFDGELTVRVVDDGSPIDAAIECSAAGIDGPRRRLELLRRPNGGPGAARNTGLDACRGNTDYVAFLDSDDEWTPDHLSRAVGALSSGFVFYFSDHYQLGQDVGAFKRAGRLDMTVHRPLPDRQEIFAFVGDLFDQVVRGNVVGTSTVVFDFGRLADLRFREEYRNAGEDYLFWMSIAVSGARACFSTRVEARYGRGVNVYSGSGWGTEQHSLLLHNEIRFRRHVLRSFPLTEAQDKHVRTDLRRLREAFALDLMHRSRVRAGIPWTMIASHAKIDPATFATMPISVLRRLLAKR